MNGFEIFDSGRETELEGIFRRWSLNLPDVLVISDSGARGVLSVEDSPTSEAEWGEILGTDEPEPGEISSLEP